MITIHVDAHSKQDLWDPKNESFVTIPACPACDLKLEHSLISVSKWESKWHEPFISKKAHTEEQTRDYVRCMTINQNVPDSVYENLSSEDIKKISEYVNDPMSATTISDTGGRSKNRDIITSELIYYWMTELQIPFEECQKWHLNRLLKLIEVCNAKKSPPKKMSQREVIERNKALNAARRAKYNSKG